MLRLQTFQQTLVMAGLVASGFSEGFIFGQLSGMVDGLRAPDSDIILTADELSTIASIINVICFGGFLLMMVTNELLGRRRSIIILTAPVIVSWVMVYFSADKSTLLASRVIAGVSFGGVMMTCYMCVGEYLSPAVRALCMNVVVSVGLCAGTVAGHLLSTAVHWRYVALVGLVPSTLSAILPIFWVESPSWLAHNGRFDECEKAFRCLHVPSEASDKELHLLLMIQKSKKYKSDHKNALSLLARNVLDFFKKRSFWKLWLLVFILLVYRVAAGRVLFSTFAISMIQDMTHSDSITSFTLFIDGFMLIGSFLSCVTTSKFNLRTLILTSGMLANVIQVLFVVSLYVWQERYDYVVWVKVSLLACYLILVNAGPYAVTETLLTELYPLKIKSFMSLLSGVTCGLMQYLGIQYAPDMFVSVGYHGVFLINVLLTFLCLTYLYFYLPETKGRTLQEIEFYFKNNSFEVSKGSPQAADNEPLNSNVTGIAVQSA